MSVLKRFQKTRLGSMSKTVDIPDASSELMISDSKNFDTVFFLNSRWKSVVFEAVSENKTRVHEQNGWYPRCFFRTHDFRLQKFWHCFFELKMEQCRFLNQFHNITNFKKSIMPTIFVAISFIFSHVTENCHSIEIILALLAMPRTWGIILCIFFWIILPPSLPCPGLVE